MSAGNFTESVVEQAALAWLEAVGYGICGSDTIAPGSASVERASYGDVILTGRLRQALRKLNPRVPAAALDEAFRKLTRPDSPSLIQNNHTVHKYLVDPLGQRVHERTNCRDQTARLCAQEYTKRASVLEPHLARSTAPRFVVDEE